MEASKENLEYILTLPDGFEYSHFKLCGEEKLQFHCKNLNSKEEVDEWVKLFGEHEYIEWRIARTYPHLKAVKCHYRVDYRCQHSSTWYESKAGSSRISKNIQCPAQLIIKIVTLSKYDQCPTTIICLQNHHNHSCEKNAGLLKYRSVSTETQDYLRKLYTNGHSPSSAYSTLRSDAFIQFPDEYCKIANDRNKIPNMSYCFNLFYKEFKKEMGLKGEKTFDYNKLKSKLEMWSIESGGSVGIDMFNNDVVISIRTPLMKRIHSKIAHFKDLIYIDSSVQCDRGNRRCYLFCTDSICGALPLGYIIIDNVNSAVFEASLRQYVSLDDNMKSHLNGPSNIITENDLMEQSVLKNVWPCSNVFLSSTYVLRSVWQWIVNVNHHIYLDDRCALYLSFKDILTAETIDEALSLYSNFSKSDSARKYPKFFLYIETTWWSVKESWCLYSRYDILNKIRNKNYAECAIRTLKDILLKQIKVYSTPQLVDFIIKRFDRYYSRRIIDFINGRFSLTDFKHFLPESGDVSLDQVVSIGNDTYIIKNLDKVDYVIDISLGLCTCFLGLAGRFCKHQSAILSNMEMTNVNYLPNAQNRDARELLFTIATGGEAPKEWFTDELSNDEVACGQKSNVDAFFDAVEVEYVSSQEESMYMNKEVVKIIFDSQDLESTFNCIVERVKESKSTEMIEAANKFCRNYQKSCTTNESLQTALSTFGECDSSKRKRKRSVT